MKAVIQCALRKRVTAKPFVWNGTEIAFVANPAENTKEACPWALVPHKNMSWIEHVRRMKNPNLTKCGELYRHHAYGDLIQKLGEENVYVLSAGWGLVRADRPIPAYDVTFSPKALPRARTTPLARCKGDSFDIKVAGEDEVHLFLTSKYLEYWECLFPGSDRTNRFILHSCEGAVAKPQWAGRIKPVNCGGARTNWHYIAVRKFLEDMA